MELMKALCAAGDAVLSADVRQALQPMGVLANPRAASHEDIESAIDKESDRGFMLYDALEGGNWHTIRCRCDGFCTAEFQG